MRGKKRLFSICLAAAMVVSILPMKSNASPVEEKTVPASMKLWYDEPASQTGRSVSGSTEWEAATLPIGNGKIGANVYGEIDKEHLTINEETLWSGGRGSVTNYDGGNPDNPQKAKDAYNKLADYYVNGQWTSYKKEALKGDPEATSGYNDGYQPLGDLYFEFEGQNNVTSYQRDLNIEEGTAGVTYQKGATVYNREYFVSHPDNVLVSRFTSGDPLNMTVSFTSKQQNTTITADQNGKITAVGKVANNGLLHNTQIKVVADGGTIQSDGRTVSINSAQSVTVYLTTATDYKNQFSGQGTEYYYRTGETSEELSNRVSQTLESAVNKGYDQVKADHSKDYKKLYDRVKLDLGQSNTKTTDVLLKDYKNNRASANEQRYLETLMFQYGRYLLISGSREDSQIPTTLQGIWNDTSGTDWNSDIHTNINLQMNYWLSGNCNLTECAKPLVDYMSKLKEPGGRTVEIYTGSQHGIMAHTQNTPYGYTAPGWEIKTWGWSPAAATWLIQNCYDYYQFSGDKNTLRDVIYPMMKDQVLMYQELLRDKNGRKVMPIALSPEIDKVTAGNTFEQSIIWQLYADTIEAASILGEQVPQEWKTTMDALKPIEIGNSKQIKEWYEETTINSVSDTRGHRHLSNLLGLYPGDLIDTSEKVEAAKVSLNNKNFGKVGTEGQNPDGGWTYAQMMNSWARVGEGDNAYFCVKQMLKNRFFENLWDYHNAAIFQIDGNYGYSAGVAEMLVQSNMDKIRLLPAISKEWASGNVSGLLTEGGYTVDMTWADSQVKEATLTASKNGTCNIVNPFQGKAMQVTCNGEKVTCTEQNGVYSFASQAGGKYVITESTMTPEPPTPTPDTPQLKAVRNQDGSVTLTWEGKQGVTYKVYRRVKK